ncbi:MAG: peptidylprolyl isomerase [Halobacteriales archaeon]|nr:peptidylprolyl isomerase [Halobacteriales archaeon]
MSDEPEAETAAESEEPESVEADTEAEEPADDGDEQTEDSAAETTEEATAEGLQDGDFVRLDYTMRTVEDGNLVDTTHEEIAEEEGIDTDEQEFGPRTIVIGAGHVFDEVESDLIGKEVGDTGTVTISAKNAFGEFDPDDVRTVSADRIPEDDRRPGAHVDIDGEHGHVETVIGGRARVDFNHPLAGEDIEYEYEILEVVEDRLEKAKGLFGMYMDVEPEMYFGTEEEEQEVPVEDDGEDSEESDEDEPPEMETEVVELETLYVVSTPQLTMNQQWMFSKQQIAQEIMDRVDVDRIVVREVLDQSGGMGLGGLGGMMGGAGAGGGDLEDALEDVEVDADELAEELDIEGEEAPDIEE